VTANHPYWSADREDFIPAGELRIGEQVDTIFGLRRVTGLAPRPGPPVTKVYNLETLEHVYRVGELGTLVHNSYALRRNLIKAGSYGNPGTAAHHIVARADKLGANARKILKRFKIDLDSHWNGVWLRSNSSSEGFRGAIHSKLHNTNYYRAVETQLEQATTRAQALKILQNIRSELLNGTFPGSVVF
jgi:hypothetical protein